MSFSNKVAEVYHKLTDGELEEAVRDIYELDNTGILKSNSIIRIKIDKEMASILGKGVIVLTDHIPSLLREFAYRKLGLI